MCPRNLRINNSIPEDLVAVGYIVKTHGVKGDVKVISLSDIPGRFKSLKRVYIQKPSGEIKKYYIKRTREIRGGILVSFDPPISMEEAQALVKGYIKIPVNEVPRLGEDSYYHFEILGMKVFTISGEYMGEIKDIISTGSNDVYIVRKDKEEYLIPAIKDVVQEVNVKERRMTIVPIDGLFSI